MMINLFEAIADRVRQQADDFAKAQARIGSRTLAHVMDPFGLASAVAGSPPLHAPAGTELRPPRLKTGRRAQRRQARPAGGRRSRGSRSAVRDVA